MCEASPVASVLSHAAAATQVQPHGVAVGRAQHKLGVVGAHRQPRRTQRRRGHSGAAAASRHCRRSQQCAAVRTLESLQHGEWLTQHKQRRDAGFSSVTAPNGWLHGLKRRSRSAKKESQKPLLGSEAARAARRRRRAAPVAASRHRRPSRLHLRPRDWRRSCPAAAARCRGTRCWTCASRRTLGGKPPRLPDTACTLPLPC